MELSSSLLISAGGVAAASALAYILYYREYYSRILQTSRRDYLGIRALFALKFYTYIAFKKNEGIQRYWLKTVAANRDKEAIYDMTLEKSFTFKELNELACKYANVLQRQGFRSGDVVAILLENGVDFVAAWLGCAKLGVVSAWINANLRNESLAHSLRVASAAAVITSSGLQQAIKDILSNEEFKTLKVFVTGKTGDFRDLSKLMIEAATTEPKIEVEPTFQSPLCYIYTSGTTGLPKAAVIKHFRYFYISIGGPIALGVRPKTDRLYLSLPLYHTSAGVLGLGQTIINGATSVIRQKFSASNFWSDCARHGCTASQYIGELCRYLLTQPPSENDKKHSVRLMIGNGLRPAIWKIFVNRFGIERIAEFYGSTEGTSNLVNIDNKEGACGFMTIMSYFVRFYPIRLLKVDEETGELVRNEKGYCIPCQPGETGLLVCTIHKNNPLLHFEGYLDSKETGKKVIKEPLGPGSDLLYWDRLGYLYFKDRTGDTYRWKGENVSTTEVEHILQPMTELQDCTVYGVEIPGTDGRAGMIAITVDKSLNLSQVLNRVQERLSNSLPVYAIPVFIRIREDLEKTGTFKLKKGQLQKEAFWPEACGGDQLFYLDPRKKAYAPLDLLAVDAIRDGKIRF